MIGPKTTLLMDHHPSESFECVPKLHFYFKFYLFDGRDAMLKPVNASRQTSNAPIPNNVLYRLSDIENDDEDEGQAPVTKTVPDGVDDFFGGEWQTPFTLSEFQPNQFFPDWTGTSTLDGKEVSSGGLPAATSAVDIQADAADATNGNDDGKHVKSCYNISSFTYFHEMFTYFQSTTS